jgi:leader peptidase (prepilin peptidase)/N-methyltransferase
VLPRLHSLEWPNAIVFGLLAWSHGPGVPLVVYSVFAAVILLVLAIDLHHRWVYAAVGYPAVVLGLVLGPWVHPTPLSTLLGAALGGGLFLTLYWVGRLLYHGAEPMGTGDITIATMIGAMVGVENVLAALFLGGVLVAASSFVLLLLRRARWHDYLPYGAGLCSGALLVLCAPGGISWPAV